MAKKILLVDDEPRLLSLLKDYLHRSGFKILTAQNGREALDVCNKEQPDLIILDIMMPEMDGYEFMRLHRQEKKTPIILLTARVEDDEKVIGLELGADDYVTKPFRPRELVARVSSVLRRTGTLMDERPVYSIGSIYMNTSEHTVRVAGKLVTLTHSEFEILTCFLGAPGRVFSRLDLLDAIQGVRYQGYERTIDTHIKNLRKKLNLKNTNTCIETIYGVGYRIIQN
jgi:DNA-binding response OmpR family regulator